MTSKSVCIEIFNTHVVKGVFFDKMKNDLKI